jgi:hypothetical protein
MQGKNRKNSRKTRPAVSTGQAVIEGDLRKEITIGKIIGHMQNIEYLSLRRGYNDMSWSLGNAACRGESTFPCLIPCHWQCLLGSVRIPSKICYIPNVCYIYSMI